MSEERKSPGWAIYWDLDPWKNEDIRAMITRLRVSEITDWKVDALAQAAHRATPWAGRPIPWEELGEAVRAVSRDKARRALEMGVPGS